MKNFLLSFGIKMNRFDVIGCDENVILALNHAKQRIKNGKRVGKVVLVLSERSGINIVEFSAMLGARLGKLAQKSSLIFFIDSAMDNRVDSKKSDLLLSDFLSHFGMCFVLNLNKIDVGKS